MRCPGDVQASVRPRILGLTASPLNTKGQHGLYSTVFEQLEINLDAKVSGSFS